MNVARECASGRAVGCTDQQLVALGYRALSLDLQVTKDSERINELREALAEALDGWEHDMSSYVEDDPDVAARIAVLRAKIEGR